MRFASLGSGSRGNATLVEAGDTCLLIDCGFPLRELERRLGVLGRTARDLSAIVVTHEHADHVRGVGATVRRHGTRVLSTRGTARAGGLDELPGWQPFDSHAGSLRVGDIEVLPYAVPHDAREPCQFVLASGRWRLGVLTDAGRVTPHIAQTLATVDALLLECNHDPDMLAAGPYPPALRARVGGPLGHLSNGQAAALLAQLDCGRLAHLVAGHLSEKNNRPVLARAALLEAAHTIGDRLAILAQDAPSPWFTL